MAAVRVVAFGTTTVLLLLSCSAAVAAGALGGRWVAIAAALDPALPGSLPDLWGLALLAAAVVALVSLGGRAAGFAHLRLAALTPLALLLADSTSAVAHLATVLGGKLVASATVGGAALAPALALWLGSGAVERRLGRALVARLLVCGSAAAALDLLWTAAEAAEEVLELLLYSSLGVGLATGVTHAEAQKRKSRFGT